MSKVFFLLIFIGFLFLYPQVHGLVKAQQIDISPKQFFNRDTVKVNIEISKLIPDKKYSVSVQNGSNPLIYPMVEKAPDSNGKISFFLCSSGSAVGFFIEESANPCVNAFQEGHYFVRLYEDSRQGRKSLASDTFQVSIKTAGSLEFVNTSFTTTDDIIIKISDLIDGSYKILVNGQDPHTGGPCLDAKNGSFQVNIGKYYEGAYNIQIYTNVRSAFHPLCGQGSLVTYRSFSINNTLGGKPGPVVGAGTTSPAGTVTVKQCKSEKDPTFNKDKDMVCALAGGISCENKNDGRGPAFATAIGCIHTNPTEFVKDFLKFIIGIGGGLAFLMMLLGVFQMLTSAGNPETLSAGRDRFQSAIIGLLFIVFAVLLLQIIGFDILRLPDFNR